MIFEKEGLKVPVDIKLSVGSAEKNVEGIYSADIDESKIAPQDLFNYEPISTGSNNKIASTGDMSTLPLKEARITGIKPQYCNGGGYDKTTGQQVLNDTNYKINYEGITDTLIVPYQVEIDEEMYRVTEVNLTVTGRDGMFIGNVGLPNIENIIYPDTVKKIIGIPNLDNGEYTEKSVLKTCILPSKITEIPERLFRDSQELTEISIPKGITKIGEDAFSNCKALRNVNIPNGVTEIGSGAFSSCTKLASVTYKGNTYTSKSAIEKALTDAGVTVEDYVFNNTALSD